jgi:hypothetical protein
MRHVVQHVAALAQAAEVAKPRPAQRNSGSVMRRTAASSGRSSAYQQHDAPHRPAGHALDAAEQLRLAGEPAATVVAHTSEDGAQGPVPPPGVRLVDHLHLAAAVALDRRNHDGNATNGSPMASAPEGGSVPSLRQWRLGGVIILV